MKVFLGGTCNGSFWREDLISKLIIDYFNPVVPDWTEECYQEELRQREVCDYVLYTITPAMTGVYSIAEVVDDSNKRPRKTILCILTADGSLEYSQAQFKSLLAVSKMVEKNGGLVFTDLSTLAEYLNILGIYDVK